MDVELNRLRVYQKAPKELQVGRKVIDTRKVKGPDSQLYTSICPMVYAIRIFGLAPYEFHNDMLVPSNVNSIFSYICAFIYSYIIYTIVVRFMEVTREQPLLHYTENGKTVCNYCMALCNIIIALLSREKFAKIWNTIQDYDEAVKNFGYTRSETKTCLWTWFVLITSIILWSIISLSGIDAFVQPWVENVAYMSIYVGTSLSVIKFSGITMLLGQRFEHLNDIAKKSNPGGSRRWLGYPVVATKDVELLHNTLMNASESLNELYSGSLLLWLGTLTFYIISSIFFLLQRALYFTWEHFTWKHAERKILTCLLSWTMAYLAQLGFLTYACHFTSAEANNTAYILMAWKRWFKTSGFSRGRYESVETSMHLINRRLNFAAGGCFYVNLPLLRSIATLLATYLVILLQFPD